MNLYVDIGNSRVKWACGDHNALHEAHALVLADTPDWVQRLPLPGVRRVIVASVAATASLAVLRAQAAVHGVPVHVAHTSARVGDVVNAYAHPENHGVDRWMACLAAYTRGPGSVLVADAGTAITLDWVDARGQHGGGLIAPGLGAMRSTLRAHTQLRPEAAIMHGDWLATDTDGAIASGTLHSAVALLDNAVVRMQPARLLLAGGDAGTLARHLAHDWQIAPQLVLEGLAYYSAHTMQTAQAPQGAGQMAQNKSK